MPRYFYDEPLAAAWMAKHFGMRFFSDKVNPGHGCPLWLSDLLDDGFGNRELFIPVERLGEVVKSKRCYIHPDSLHLLDLVDGDKVTRSMGVVGCFGRAHQDGPQGVYWAGTTGFDPPDGNEQIIERDGKPFFAPESEP